MARRAEILVMASPVFEAMFYGSLKEGNDPIPIPDMLPAAFKALVEYIYTDNIKINSCDVACDLFYGAQKYMLPQVQTVCVEYLLAGNFNTDIVCSIYEFALVVGDEKLIEQCELVIQSKTTEVLKGGSFLDVKLDTVVKMFSLPFLNVENELVLVRAAELYDRTQQKARTAKMFETAVENSKEKDIFKGFNTFKFTFGSPGTDLKTFPEKNETKLNSTSSKSDEDLLKETYIVHNGNDNKLVVEELTSNNQDMKARPILPLLCKINFLSLTTQQIAEEISLRALLTSDELLAVVMNAASTNTFVPMPSGFSLNRNRREHSTFFHQLGRTSHSQ